MRLARIPGGIATFAGALVVLLMIGCALLAPLLAPYSPLAVDLAHRLEPPNAVHWFGTDQAGRDVLSRVIWGARPSLVIGLVAVVIGLLFGVTIGLVAGYFGGGWMEQAVMRGLDAMAAIPLLIWAIAVVGILGVNPVRLGPFTFPNEVKVMALLGMLYIPGLARLAHVCAKAEATSDYVAARRLQGVGEWRILFSDVLPNCVPPLMVQASLLVAVGILVEAAVSFVGLGVQPPASSWGTMLSESRNFLFSGEWWLSVFPGLSISLTVIGFNLLGDGLRDALDPRRNTAPLTA